MTPASKIRRKKKNQKGAGMLETALVTLTLVGMIIFIVDIGRILLIQQFVTERTRVTVRNAVVNNWDATATKNFLVYNNTTAPDGGGPGYLGLLTSQVSYTTLGTAGQPDYRLQVKVSGIPVLTWIPHIAGQFTLPPVTATMPAQSLGSTT